MAKPGTTNNKQIKKVIKLTNQGGRRVKTSSMSKHSKKSHKKYAGQGK
jgi:hypothetical protein